MNQKHTVKLSQSWKKILEDLLLHHKHVGLGRTGARRGRKSTYQVLRLHKLLQVMTSRSCLRKMKSLQSCYQSRSLLWRIWNIFCFAILFSCFPHKPKCVVSSILVDSSKLLCEGWHCTPKHQTWRKKKQLQTENALNLFYSPFILMWKKLHFPAFPVLICTSDLLGRCLIRPLLQ